MRNYTKLAAFVLALLASAASGSPLGMQMIADPGTPDTLRIDSVRVPIPPTQPIKVPVRFFNDEALSALEVTIQTTAIAGDPVTLDSVSFFGSRIGYLNFKGFSIQDNVVTIFGLVSGEANIPAGNGLLCNLWFTANLPYAAYFVTLDTTTYTFGMAEHSTVFSDGSLNGIVPTVKTGYIDFEQACCVGTKGNMDGSEIETPDLSDLQVLIDYLFRFPGNYRPLCLEEANLDGDVNGRLDVTDLSMLIDWLIGTTPTLPACP